MLFVLCEHRNDDYFHEMSTFAVDNKMLCVTVWIDGSTIMIGPFFVPGETACYGCMTHREFSGIKFIKEHTRWLEQQQKASKISSGNISVLGDMAASLLVSYALAFVFKKHHLLPFGEMVVVESFPVNIEHHRLFSVMGCKVCDRTIY
jgi:bacteriocin biosynthesis cyclodehydratase domain-containing protein